MAHQRREHIAVLRAVERQRPDWAVFLIRDFRKVHVDSILLN